MELTRIRQTADNLASKLTVTYEMLNGASYIPRSAVKDITGGGVAKITKDTGVKANTSKRNRAWNGDSRTIAGFLPFSVSTLQIGNSRFSGCGHIFCPSFAGTTIRRNVFLTGDILGSIPFYKDSGMYPGDVDARGVPPSCVSIDPQSGRVALNAALAETSEAVYDLGITLAELAETAAMLANPIQGLVKLSQKMLLSGGVFKKLSTGKMLFKPSKKNRSLRRFGKQFKDTSYRIVDESSNFWLTYRFGVKPLLQDIRNLLNMDFDNFSDPGILLSRGKAGGRKVQSSISNSVETLAYFQVPFRDTIVEKFRHNATVAYTRKHGGGIEAFLSAFGLNWWQIPKILWELVPCSFVVDRFVDVGTWLSNVRPDPHVKVLDSCVSASYRKTRTREAMGLKYKSFVGNVDWSKSRVPMLKVYSSSYVRETGWASTPIFPSINPRLLKLEQQIDHATLIWQRLPKRR